MSALFYNILQWYLRFYSGFYFRGVSTNGLENVPKKGAVIFAVNHQNAFLDALLVALYSGRKPYFLARGDVFNHPIANFFLRIFRLYPIFRFRDGMEGLRKNNKTLESTYEILGKRHALIIFPEGYHDNRYLLRPLQKGCARIFYEMAVHRQMDNNIAIVPVGIHYTHHDLARTEVVMNFGQAIHSNSLAASPTDQRDYVSELTAKLEKAMRALVIDLPAHNYDSSYDEWSRKRTPLTPANEGFMRDKQLSDSAQIQEVEVTDTSGNSRRILYYAKAPVGILLLFPIALWGYINNYPAYKLFSYILKNKIEDPQFTGSMKFVAGAIYFPLIWLLQTLILSPLLGNWSGIYLLLLAVSALVLWETKSFIAIRRQS